VEEELDQNEVERQKKEILELCMNQSHLCYRNLIDIILKLQIKNISLSDYGEVKKFL